MADLASAFAKPKPPAKTLGDAFREYQEPSALQSAWDEISGAFARYGRRSGAQRDASLEMLNQAVAPGTDPLTGAGMKALGLAGLVTHPLAFFPTGDEWRERLSNAGNTGRLGQAIGGALGDLPSIVDPHLLAGGGALAAAPLIGKMAGKVDDVASMTKAESKIGAFDDAVFPDDMDIPTTANTIESIAKAAGLRVKRGMSEKSDSEYVTLARADDEDGVFDEIKIRVSDHDLPSYYAESTYDVGTHGGGIQGGWVAALDEAFADLGMTPPTLTAQRQAVLNSVPEWARDVFRKQFEKARTRSEEFAKKKGQPEG